MPVREAKVRFKFLREEQFTDSHRGKRGRMDMVANVGLAGGAPSV